MECCILINSYSCLPFQLLEFWPVLWLLTSLLKVMRSHKMLKLKENLKSSFCSQLFFSFPAYTSSQNLNFLKNSFLFLMMVSHIKRSFLTSLDVLLLVLLQVWSLVTSLKLWQVIHTFTWKNWQQLAKPVQPQTLSMDLLLDTFQLLSQLLYFALLSTIHTLTLATWVSPLLHSACFLTCPFALPLMDTVPLVIMQAVLLKWLNLKQMWDKELMY